MLPLYTYKIKKRRVPITGVRTPTAARDAEELSGIVRGFQASAIEERFARALERRNIDYYFRYALGNRGLPGWRELDFLVIWFGYRPFEIEDISFIHRGTQAEDAWKDAQTMDFLKQYNPYPVQHVNNTQLYDQDAADATVRRLLG